MTALTAFPSPYLSGSAYGTSIGSVAGSGSRKVYYRSEARC